MNAAKQKFLFFFLFSSSFLRPVRRGFWAAVFRIDLAGAFSGRVMIGSHGGAARLLSLFLRVGSVAEVVDDGVPRLLSWDWKPKPGPGQIIRLGPNSEPPGGRLTPLPHFRAALFKIKLKKKKNKTAKRWPRKTFRHYERRWGLDPKSLKPLACRPTIAPPGVKSERVFRSKASGCKPHFISPASNISPNTI